MNRSSTRTPSVERSVRASPHYSQEAKEREVIIRWRHGDPDLPSPPSYVPSPQGSFFATRSPGSARQSGSRVAKNRSRSRSPNSSSPVQARTLQSQSPAPQPPPALPPSQQVQCNATPPTRTVSPSKRATPLSSMAPASLKTPSPGVKFSTDTDPQSPTSPTYSMPGSPTGSLARDVQYDEVYDSAININDCRHLIGRGTQQDRQAAQWAHSLRGAASSPFLNTKMHPHPSPKTDVKDTQGFVTKASSRERSISTQVRSLSTDAYLSLGQGGKPLRLTVSAKDKWTTIAPQQWVVPPLERLNVFSKRCGLAEPAAPKIDKSFNGFVVKNITKDTAWHSASDPNMTMMAFGVESGDELAVSTVWATYRTRP